MCVLLGNMNEPRQESQGEFGSQKRPVLRSQLRQIVIVTVAALTVSISLIFNASQRQSKSHKASVSAIEVSRTYECSECLGEHCTVPQTKALITTFLQVTVSGSPMRWETPLCVCGNVLHTFLVGCQSCWSDTIGPKLVTIFRLCSTCPSLSWRFHVMVAGCNLSLIHIWRCRRSTLCRSRWSPYH